MGTNNDILQNDSFTFSEECRKAIQYYFSLFTFVVMDYHGTIGEIPNLFYFYKEERETEEWLFYQLQSNVMFKVEALPSLLLLRNKLSNLLMQSKAVYQDENSFIEKHLSTACVASLVNVLAFVDNEINDLESLQADELESVVSSSSQTSNVPETALNEPTIERESFDFDVTADFKNKLCDIFGFLCKNVIDVEDYERDFATFSCSLFGGDTYKEHKIKLQDEGINGIASFYGEMRRKARKNPKATIKDTVQKWYVNNNGEPLVSETIRNNTNTNEDVCNYVRKLFHPDSNSNISGKIDYKN